MDNFVHKTQEIIRNVMRFEKQDETKSTAWKGNDCRGFEIVFESNKRGILTTSGVIAHAFITLDGGFEVVLNCYIIKENLRCIVDTSSIPDSSSFPSELTNALSKLIIATSSCASLSHILMLSCTRDKILSLLDAKLVAGLSGANRLIRAALASSEVDRTFWKHQLQKEFGAEKVREAIATKKSFRDVFSKSMLEKKTTRARRENTYENDGLRDFRAIPYRNPQPMHPLGYDPDPDAEFFRGNLDPLNPIPDPRRPPGGGLLIDPRHNPGVPRNPLGGGRGGNPDLDPFGDPMNREIFGPPRGGGGFQGNPFMRGGGGGFI